MTDEAAATVPATVAAVRRGAIAAADIVQRSLATIARLEPRVRAWAHVAPEPALIDAAARVDPGAPLSGIPIGTKDVIDVAAMPTGYGAVLLYLVACAPWCSLRCDSSCWGCW